jgi:Uma2 family endonuclease
MSSLTNLIIPQGDPPRPPHEVLPTMYDLPSEDPEEPGLPDEFHDLQPQLLSRTLQLVDYTRDNCFTASDLNLYYDGKHPLWQKRPDWFLVVDVPRLYNGEELRRSYVTWLEGKSPDVVVEFLSPGTERGDLGRFFDESWQIPDSSRTERNEEPSTKTKPPGKFEVYERYLRVPHYIVFSRYDQRLRYFRLEGRQYQEQPLNSENPRIWLADLEIGLGIWTGTFEGIPGNWLRWCDRAGNWLLTDTEQERILREQAETAQAQAQAQLFQAAQNLLATGMNLDQVAQILNLSQAQIDQLQSEAE